MAGFVSGIVMSAEKRVFLFGGTSMLGWSVLRHPGAAGIQPFCNPYTELPALRKWPRIRLEDERAVANLFAESPPDLLLHCGGVCDVDKCERHPDWARKVNVASMHILLKYLPAGARLVYCSSDHVFSGDGSNGYDETTRPDPLTVYGRCRTAAEEAVFTGRPDALVIRSGLAIGPSVDGRSGHLDWLRYRASHKLRTTVVADEYRSVVWARDLADRVLAMAHSSITGLRHITAAAVVSRWELAEYLNHRFQLGASIEREMRTDRHVPHLGRIALRTRYRDDWATALPAVVSLRPARTCMERI